MKNIYFRSWPLLRSSSPLVGRSWGTKSDVWSWQLFGRFWGDLGRSGVPRVLSKQYRFKEIFAKPVKILAALGLLLADLELLLGHALASLLAALGPLLTALGALLGCSWGALGALSGSPGTLRERS